MANKIAATMVAIMVVLLCLVVYNVQAGNNPMVMKYLGMMGTVFIIGTIISMGTRIDDVPVASSWIIYPVAAAVVVGAAYKGLHYVVTYSARLDQKAMEISGITFFQAAGLIFLGVIALAFLLREVGKAGQRQERRWSHD